MMGFRDMTFCADKSCAKFSECERALTEEVKEDAEEWWGNKNYPITMFAARVGCYEEPTDETD